jgi:hypothetical protein
MAPTAPATKVLKTFATMRSCCFAESAEERLECFDFGQRPDWNRCSPRLGAKGCGQMIVSEISASRQKVAKHLERISYTRSAIRRRCEESERTYRWGRS